MQALPISARLFVWGIILGGAIMLLLLTPSIPFGHLESMIASTFLALVILLADVYRIHLPFKAEVSVSMSIAFATLLLFGPGLACWAAAIGDCLAEAYLKKPWYKALFNSANSVLSIGLAGLVYQSVYDGSQFPLVSARGIIALLLSMAVCLVINTMAVSTIIALVDQQSPWRVWSANYEGVLIQLLTLAPLGTLIAMAYSQTPYGLGSLLLLLPLGAVYYSFKSYQQLRDQTRYTIEALAGAIDKRDPYTFQHSQRVMEYVKKIAERLNSSPVEIESIVWAASIHDLGKIDVPDGILSKPSHLDNDEWEIVRKHPAVGADIVARISFYPTARDIIRYHHEWFDGSGYPSGIGGDRIPLGARILAVADAFEAMTSDRPYRSALSYQAAVAELEAGKGTQFDPVIVDTFLTILEEEPIFKPVKAQAKEQA
ncbi:MAG: HD-GYP domain-containing protein [Anaerolineae bacterium]|nr:HD-GYP domain-containing protein [Anaerolineae bacterium]